MAMRNHGVEHYKRCSIALPCYMLARKTDQWLVLCISVLLYCPVVDSINGARQPCVRDKQVSALVLVLKGPNNLSALQMFAFQVVIIYRRIGIAVNRNANYTWAQRLLKWDVHISEVWNSMVPLWPLISFHSMCNIVSAHLQVLHHYSMPSLAVVLAPSFWMTCCVLVLRQDSLTVQGLPVRELGHMTSVQMAMVKMLVSDVLTVSDSWNIHNGLLIVDSAYRLHAVYTYIHTQTTNKYSCFICFFMEKNVYKIHQFVRKPCLKDSLTAPWSINFIALTQQ